MRRLQAMVRAREEERRGRSGEDVRPFSRKKNYYDRLGVPRDSSMAEVRRSQCGESGQSDLSGQSGQ